MFRLDKASFSIGNKSLIQPISTTFKTGKVYGLIGHNGSGKSTLIKLLAKQMSVTGGDIFFEEKELSLWKNRAFAREVAYLPQYLPIATGLTAQELILMGRFSHNGFLGLSQTEDQKILKQVLAHTHTEKFQYQLVDTLSGGERQRIWLAMCLVQQSRFLLLDEPISALDIAHQVDVMALIHKLAHELNLGIIIVIHDINLAAQYCDEFVALKQGALCFTGPAEDLMHTEVLHDIYGVSLQIVTHPITRKAVALV